jgi:hypothetical protein
LSESPSKKKEETATESEFIQTISESSDKMEDDSKNFGTNSSQSHSLLTNKGPSDVSNVQTDLKGNKLYICIQV